MEAESSHCSQIIDINLDLPGDEPSINRNKICSGSACGFSDSQSNSKEAQERFTSMRKLLIAVVLCIIFMSVEVVGGWEATPRQSYGFFRIEILGALVSIQLIWLLTGILVYEAIARLLHDTGEVQGVLMFIVSAFGLVVNIVMAVLLGHDHGHGHGGHDHGHGEHGHTHSHVNHGHTHHHEHDAEHGQSHATGHDHAEDSRNKEHREPLLHPSGEAATSREDAKEKTRNINVRSAYLHVLGDSVQSIGVMIGGAIIWWKPEWKMIDMLCTLVFSVIVLVTTIKMLRDILEVLMESTPRQIDATKLEQGLCRLDGVVAIHELHIWAITVGKVLLACHVTITQEADADLVLDTVVGYIKREYNISHVTIQIERQ
ncbi:metal tolerance protein [Musa troglodytarum]|uniref:Metal tolerance protein n=1 Tax=Musa troglodytarum TaxID=320322 RepID=A0A9E7GQB3_9LILI|nr:metal tolerance protein [Musa troglodytarum]